MNLRIVVASASFGALLLGCASQPTNNSAEDSAANEQSQSAADSAPTQAPTGTSPKPISLAEKLASEARPLSDRSRDIGRNPVDVIDFLGIEPGMQVLDMLAYSGYYTEVLSHAVGPTGQVLCQNPAAVLELSKGANERALNQRLSNNRLPNVTRVNREFDNLGIPPASLDAAITALNLHDLYHVSPDHAVEVLTSIYAILKPGGVFGVIDHIGVPGRDNVTLHRMTRAQALEVASAAGFEFVEESDLLANPYDDHSLFVFGPELRGITDRFLLKLVRPAASLAVLTDSAAPVEPGETP